MGHPETGRGELAPGELACVRLIIQGMTDAEIAASLNISAATAHWRIERAKKKLGVRTRAQLAAHAVARRLVEL
jgi:DNA-binding CsgD family transcriptional regulator